MSTVRHCARCGRDFPAEVDCCPDDGTQLVPAEPSQPAVPSKAGVVIDNRYLLEERIGAGGLGEIYRARHLRMHRAFAVKLLHTAKVKRPDFRGRFEREAQALSRLTHPCCVAVTDFGVSDEHGPFIVMELVEGLSLSTFTRGQGLPLGEAVELIVAVLAGLEHAHDQGIVHRDIKPDNIMIVEQPLGPGQRMPKILDFGLARIRAGFDAPGRQTLTEAGFVIGTPHYLAPERVTNPTTDDPRSDLYSVGVLLFELCCGRRPFEADETPRVVEMHLDQSPPAPSQLRPDIPRELEVLILRALQKQPAARFVSAREFRQELERLLPLPPDIAGRRPSEVKPSAAKPPLSPLQVAEAPRPLSLRALLLPGALLVALLIAIAALVLISTKPKPLAEVTAPVGRVRRVARATAPAPTTRPVTLPAPEAAPASQPQAAQNQPAAAQPLAASSQPAAEPPTTELLEPPDAQEESRKLSPELRRMYRLWTNRQTRRKASRQFMAYLGQHRDDGAAHLFVARLYLYALWTNDGVRLVQRALAIQPGLRLDHETLMALAVAYHGPAARPLIEKHAGKRDAPKLMLAAAAAARDPQIRRSLMANAGPRAAADHLGRALLALATARSCSDRRRALQALPSFDAPYVKLMLLLMRSDRCLAELAKSRL